MLASLARRGYVTTNDGKTFMLRWVGWRATTDAADYGSEAGTTAMVERRRD